MSSLADLYLSGRGGSVLAYRSNLSRGFRIGQAFFNALSAEDAVRLRGTIFDPFYRHDNESVEKAIAFLLDSE